MAHKFAEFVIQNKGPGSAIRATRTKPKTIEIRKHTGSVIWLQEPSRKFQPFVAQDPAVFLKMFYQLVASGFSFHQKITTSSASAQVMISSVMVGQVPRKELENC